MPSLNFYVQRNVTHHQSEQDVLAFLRQPLPVWLFLPRSEWDQLAPRMTTPYRVVASHREMYRAARLSWSPIADGLAPFPCAPANPMLDTFRLAFAFTFLVEDFMGARRIRREQRRVDMAQSRLVNGVRKVKERPAARGGFARS